MTDEQRKLYAGLAVIGVLALVAGGIYIPKMLSGGSTPIPVSAQNSVTTPVDPETGVAPGVVDPAAPAAPAVVSAPSQPLARTRPDPFQQIYFIPTPTPIPPIVPPPVDVPSPVDVTPVMLPGSQASRDALQQPLNLPPVTINRLDETARRPVDAFPPRRSAGSEGGGSASANPSSDKRLSGVIISDGVRALLETQGPQGPKTTVVQPGDEVDGITVLSIQRFNDGNRTVTRMIIRENGEERSVDLKPGAVLPANGPVGLGGPGFQPGG